MVNKKATRPIKKITAKRSLLPAKRFSGVDASSMILTIAAFALSLTITAFAAAPPPSIAPTQISPASGSNVSASPTFRWGSVKRANIYRLQVANATDSLFASPVVNSTTTATSLTSPALVAASYRWRVRAENNSGPGPWSPEWGFTVSTSTPPPSDTTPPTPPANLAYTNLTTTGVSLSWSASTDNVGVTAYDVYRNNVRLTTVTTTSFNDTGLAPSTTYQYYVRARDAAGNVSSLSNIVTITTSAVPTSGLPTIYFPSLTDGSVVSSLWSFPINAQDSQGIAKIEVSIDGAAYQTALNTYTPSTPDQTTQWDYDWYTRMFANGNHTVTARATDGGGAMATVSVTAVVDNPTGPNLKTYPDGLTVSIETTNPNPATGRPWTTDEAHNLIRGCDVTAGDFGRIAPALMVKIVGDAASQTVTSRSISSNGTVYGYMSTTYLGEADGKVFHVDPVGTGCYEYGHTWLQYYLYFKHNTSYAEYIAKRWVNADGSITLAQNDVCVNKLDGWDGCMSHDYGYLLGPLVNRATWPVYDILDARKQPGLADWLKTTWIKP